MQKKYMCVNVSLKWSWLESDVPTFQVRIKASKDIFFLGGIQQLRGPNIAQFGPPTRLEWTIKDILHTTYPFFKWPNI